MNGVIRNSLKLPNSNLLGLLKRDANKNQFGTSRLFSSLKKTNCPSPMHSVSKSILPRCSSVKNYSSESSNVAVELNKFLDQEISSEEETLQSKTIPSKIDDFEVKLDGAEVTLVKKTEQETILISFNINNSVDGDEEDPELDGAPAANEPTELKSKPAFDVEIKRGNTTLAFSCEYAEESLESEENDAFFIDEVTLFEGEHSEKVYSVSGQILDGYLYDLLMNLLDSKGVTNEFILKMSDLSTAYEQSSYISLLRALKEFTSQ